MFLRKIRESHWAKVVSLLLALELITAYFIPNPAKALTTGPSQPEVQNFQPVGTSDMVNVFTGDFSYNIPLMDVDGYPINISYASGVTTDQEASWVGLGWNINPGAVNRSVRGIPDDFNGEKITKTFNMKPNRTFGASYGVGAEFFGSNFLSLNYGITANFNNYAGVGFEQSLKMEFNSGDKAKGPLSGGLGITSGADGANISPSLSFSKNQSKLERDVKGTGTIGLSFNSRSGLKKLSLNASLTEKKYKVIKNADGSEKRGEQTATYSSNGSASIDFSTQTYSPLVSMSMINTSIGLSIKSGLHGYGADASWNIGGYYSEQDLAFPVVQSPAYGYFNTQNGISDPRSMNDINREKEIAFTDRTPDLPVTNYTYDVFSVNGQGIGGNYRAFRSDLGTVCDPVAMTYSSSGNAGFEGTGGGLAHVGVDITITDVTTTSGKWTSDDNASSYLKFQYGSNANPLFEPWYFKQAGEKAVDSDPALYAAIGKSDPVKVSLLPGGNPSMHVTATSNFDRQYTDGHISNISIPTTNYRTVRQRRNQPISFLNFSDSAYALQSSILDHTHPSMAAYSSGRGNQIGEITTLRSDGARYVYGLPAYNISQKEVTFAAQYRSHDCGTGIITYDPTGNADNSVDNKLGIDNYYSAVETPAYAHSYMLTAIISPDYVDYDNVEGPSKGDLGSYTKFNYTKANSDFKWRTPVGANSANYNEGMKSESSDDKASYVYGEKEIWYVSSIETKNYIAIFHLSDREDGLGVTDENGTVGGTALKKLDRIDLYTKPDYDSNGANATPIKSVHFEYNYTLCPGTPNRNPATNGSGESGKLTLKKIYFTYQKSYKAKLSSYQFNYADNNQDGSAEANYRYNLKGYDRWANYKRNPASSSCGNYDSLTTAEFPYTDQDTSLANKYSAAWSLTSISLPSGGTIKVKYESDDYAYVQDRKAMEMFKITDVKIASSNPSFPDTTSTPHNAQLMNTSYATDQYYLFFRLQQPISSSGVSTTQAADTILKKYLGDSLKNIYFRFFSDITNHGDNEYVSGYFDVDSYGVAAAVNNTYRFGWVRVKKVPIGDREGSDACNPICVANWQYGRLNLPRKVWDQPDPQDGTIDQVITQLATLPYSTATNLLHIFKSANKTIRDKGYGLTAVMNKSWIRLNNPYGKKIGGGSRVKSVTISDNWKAMTDNSPYTPNDATYGQTYTYTTTDPSTGAVISSGVASYEPSIGGDENPFRRPVYFSEKHRLAPDDESYMEEPFGEMFFPAPGVGYSRVKVQNLQHSGVSRHATGYTVQEFYTAKDFPTITRRTDIQVVHKRTNPVLSLLRITMKDYLTASQGYVIEVNDMHGKPKAQFVYAEGQSDPISEVHYFYKVNSSNGRQLDNEVYVINKDGSVGKNTSGLDYDFVHDMREEETKMVNGGVQTNVSTFLVAIFPGIVPTIYPTWSSEDTRFRSSVITKVINRYGILERTEAHDAGSTVTTENLAWDAVTGELLVTKTKNDFDDPVYNLTYPAHWAYDHMGPAYQNLMTSFQHRTISSGSASVMNAEDYFVPGDEVGVTKESDGTHYKYWVCSVSDSSVNLIDKNGAAATVSGSNGFTLLITRSGRRNQQALAVGGVTLLANPLVDTTGDGIYDAIRYDTVINAKSQEYAQHWMMFGGHVTPGYTTCSCSATEIAGAASIFLNTLTDDGKLLTDSTLLLDNGTSTYYHSYTSFLNSSLPSGEDIYWFPHADGQLLTGLIASGPDSTGCTVTLLLPAPYTWNQVTALSDLTAISDPGNCSNGTSYTFTMKATLSSGAEVYITGTTSCWQVGQSCNRSVGSESCGKMVGDVVNPYYEDILGVWRPVRSSLYLADRKQTTGSNNVDVRKDGYFITRDHSTGSTIDFQPFWIPDGGNDWLKDSTYWTWSSEVTKYTPFSNEVENRDALSRYSAAIYGYNNTLPIAVASNARYQEIAYDGFEDYSYVDSTDCRYQHFNYYDNRSHRSTVRAHTGIYSMKVGTNDSLVSTRPLASYQALPLFSSCPYTLSQYDITGVFSPVTYNGEKKYVLNYWVREDTLTAPVFTYPSAKVIVKFLNGSGTPTYPAMTLVQKSSIIEGWQQYQYTFVIPAGQTGSIAVVLKNPGSHTAYFDDIRLHPFDANMKSYVYHPLNLRFTDELDENNYATIYEYDEDGTLTRVKKETINGIMTIKESRNNSSH